MVHDDGTLTDELLRALSSTFDRCCSEGRAEMSRADIDRYLLAVNRKLGRGSEYRFVMAALERRGDELFGRDDFISLYKEEIAEGKYWGVEHDLRALNGSGLANVCDGPCELRFDYIYYTTSSLQLLGVQDPLSQEQR